MKILNSKSQLFQIDIFEFLKGVFKWVWGFIILIVKTIQPAWPIFIIGKVVYGLIRANSRIDIYYDV